MEKEKYWQFLFIVVLVTPFVLMLIFDPASALGLASEEPEQYYEMQINDLECQLTDYELHVDLWHARIAGSYILTLTNSGDTGVLIRWNEGGALGDLKIPAHTVKKYSVKFSFNLLSRDFSYGYEEI